MSDRERQDSIADMIFEQAKAQTLDFLHIVTAAWPPLVGFPTSKIAQHCQRARMQARQPTRRWTPCRLRLGDEDLF